jgi:hypothetical protein
MRSGYKRPQVPESPVFDDLGSGQTFHAHNKPTELNAAAMKPFLTLLEAELS